MSSQNPPSRLDKILAKHTGQDLEKITHDTERDYFMSAEEAKDWGIVDHVYDRREQADSDGVKTV